MEARTVFLLSLLIALLLVAGSGVLAEMPGTTFVYLGDSVTLGANSSGYRGYVGIVSDALADQEIRLVVYHVADGLWALDHLTARANVLIVELGAHAVVGCDHLVANDPALFERYYSALIERAQTIAPTVIVMTIPWLGWEGEAAKKAELYNGIINRVAQEAGVPVVDAWTPLRACGVACISSDGVHPNDAGHALLASRIISALDAHAHAIHLPIAAHRAAIPFLSGALTSR